MDQLGIIHVADRQVHGQTVPRQADPPALQVVTKLRVLNRVKAVVAANRGRLGIPLRFRALLARPRDREEMIDHRAKHAHQLGGISGNG